MKKLLVVALMGMAVGVAAQGLITTTVTNVRKFAQLKWAAGEKHTISLDGTEFASFTVPAGEKFLGTLSFNGSAQ